MTASRRLLFGETSHMHGSGVILASTQTVFKSWRFRGPLLWTLIFSSFHRFSVGFKSGDWLGPSSSFIFFLWNQLRVSLAVCSSLSCWNVHPRFIFIILLDGSRFLSRMSRYIFPFILPSIIWSLPVLKNSPTPPPNCTVHFTVYNCTC